MLSIYETYICQAKENDEDEGPYNTTKYPEAGENILSILRLKGPLTSWQLAEAMRCDIEFSIEMLLDLTLLGKVIRNNNGTCEAK